MHRLNPSLSSGWSGTERRRLSAFGAGVIALHLLGWGLFSLFSGSYPEPGGLGALAYTLGLRHAFDADHIAAIDNTTASSSTTGSVRSASGSFSRSVTQRSSCS